MSHDLERLARAAGDIAQRAAAAILDVYHSDFAVEQKDDASPLTAADLAAHRVIVDGLVAGTWSWNTRTAGIDVDLVPGKAPAPIRRQVKARAAALTETLRSAWAP